MDITNDTQHSKFTTIVDGVEAKIIYKRGTGNAYDLVHTIVPKEIEGRGIAGELVKFAIATARAENVKIIATCPYVKRWFEKHPEQDDVLLRTP